MGTILTDNKAAVDVADTHAELPKDENQNANG